MTLSALWRTFEQSFKRSVVMVKEAPTVPKCTSLRRGFERAKDPDQGLPVISRVAKDEAAVELTLIEEAHIGLHPELSIT